MMYSNEDLFHIVNDVLVAKNILWQCTHYNNNYLNCRFGFWKSLQPNYNFEQLPSINNTELNTQSIQRCKDIGYANILWSGGVDSTYIVCSYIKANIPFKILFDKTSIVRGNYFYNWLLFNGFKDNLVYNDNWFNFKYDKMVNGDLAFLFFPTRNNSTMIINYKEYPNLIKEIQEFGEYLNKPVDTSFRVRRIIRFSVDYDTARKESNYHTGYNTISFFDTKEFSDISYTQFWENDDKEKIYFKKFISDVTNDSKMMTEVKVTKDLHLIKI